MTTLQTNSLPDFSHIGYLQNGSAIQQQVFHLLQSKKILYHLQSVNPVLAGTLPLDLFIEGKSDLDILGESNDLHNTIQLLIEKVSHFAGFFVEIKDVREIPTLICRFKIEQFPVELFIQHTPVKDQWAYRHMRIEYWLLKKSTPLFRKEIIDLKKLGVKTEPAFAKILGLEGDSYERLLEFENDPAFIEYWSTTP